MKINLLFLALLLHTIANATSSITATPNKAYAGQTLDITITGVQTHFTQGSSSSVTFSGFNQASSTTSPTINSIHTINDHQILVNISIPKTTICGDYPISVFNYLEGNLSTNFHIVGHPGNNMVPKITSINPSSGNAGQTLNVGITGVNTHFTQGSGSNVSFGFAQISTTVVNSLNILNDTSIIANVTIPSYTATDNYSVSVFNWPEILTVTNGFHVTNGITPPAITSISPNTGNAGQNLSVTITGTHTHFTQGSSSLSFGFNQVSSTSVISTNVVNDSLLTANIIIPSNTISGSYDVSYYGTNSLQNGFTVNGITAPAINSIIPNNANAGQTLNVTITGVNTNFTQASNTLSTFFSFNQGSSTVNSISLVNNTTANINLTIPSNVPTGNYNVVVNSSSDGNFLIPNGFFINGQSDPDLISISPNFGTPGQSASMTITCSNLNFYQASSTQVYFNFENNDCLLSASIDSIINDSTAYITVQIPAGISNGAYSIYLEGNGAYHSIYQDSVFFIGVTQINTLNKLDNLMFLIPNPTSNFISIQGIENSEKEASNISIYNSLGRRVILLKNQFQNIDISNLPDGFYTLNYNNGKISKDFKFIKQ